MSEDAKTKSGSPKDAGGDSASRARNRTVMLTPDITGQVRARLQQEFVSPEATGHPDEGFVTPTGGPRPGGAIAVPPSVSPTPTVASPVAPQQIPTKTPKVSVNKNPLVGFLVSYDSDTSGEYHELRSGRLIITSEEVGAGNHLVIDDDSVSPMHAILRISPTGDLQVLDQLSEHGTWIRRFGSSEEEQLSGDKSSLEHGDAVRFGKRTFIICMVAKPEE